MDEAPPVMISIRSIMLAGIVLRSTAEDELPPDTRRRPSTSTSVRLVPRPRRFRNVAPASVKYPSWLLESPVPTPNWETWFRMSPALLNPLSSIAAALMTVMGVGCSSALRAMRDPVTTTSSRVAPFSDTFSLCGSLSTDAKPAEPLGCNCASRATGRGSA